MEIKGVPLSLPPFVEELRAHQVDAASQIIEKFRDRNVVILDAPTGAGKTIIGEAVRQVMAAQFKLNQALYLCTTKSLQEQFLHDFTHAKLIKGRANYPTYDDPDLFHERGSRHLDASHCSKKSFDAADLPLCSQCEFADADARLGWADSHETDEGAARISHCHWCHPWQSCPYEIAKSQALQASLAVANTAYLLTEANYVGRFGYSETYERPQFPFMVVDEADTLESVLMGFVEVSLSKRSIDDYGIGIPELVTKPSSWLEWAAAARIKLATLAKRMNVEVESYDTDPPPLKTKRRAERIARDLQTLTYAENALRTEPDNWVLDGYQDGGVTLKPVTVSSHSRRLLWRHSKKFLLMSATVISPDQMAQDLGLSEHEWGFVSVDSNFPPERRPIQVLSRANMTNKTKESDWPKMVRAVNEVLALHPSERVLVHTVSYAWTRYLHDELRRTEHAPRILSYDDARTRESTLETYKQRPDAVLLAPSLDRGIDLPYDLCRVIVISKVPYPNLGDKQINKRFYGTGQAGKNWYVTETIRSIVQMTGRGMRHRDDYCVTYILDSQFRSNVWANGISRTRVPRWWTEALHWPPPRRQNR
jgi:ATP-dependent DNA helicase DinG